MGTARFSLTEDDLIAAQRAWWACAARWQAGLGTFAIVGPIYAALGLASTWRGSAQLRVEAIAFGLAGALVVTAILFVVGFAMTPYRARRAFREHKALAGEFMIDWDEQGIVIRHESGTTALSWNKFHAWGIGPETVMLYQSSKLFNAIPRRAIDAHGVGQIIEHMRLAGVPERKRFGFLAWKPEAAGRTSSS